MQAPGSDLFNKLMSRPRSRERFEELIRTGAEGDIELNGTTYRLVRSRFSHAEHYGNGEAHATDDDR